MKAVVAYLCREEKKRGKEGPGAEATKGLGPDRGPGEGGGACPVAMAGQVIGTTVHLLVCGAAVSLPHRRPSLPVWSRALWQ